MTWVKSHSIHLGLGKSHRSITLSRVGAVALTYAFLLAAALITLIPYLLSVMTSFKTSAQMFGDSPLSWPTPFTTENYEKLFDDSTTLWQPLAVTLLVTVVVTIGQLSCSILAAYAFACLKFFGREALFWVYLSGLLVPPVLTVIPLYIMFTGLGLRDTFWALVLPFMFGSSYAVFLLRENFKGIPQELLDAATIDGAGRLRILWSIVLPSNRPILATLTLITVVSQWNSFLWPKIITTSQTWRMMTVATAALQTQYSTNWPMILSATTLAMIPLVILFIVFQKQIVNSLGVTGIR